MPIPTNGAPLYQGHLPSVNPSTINEDDICSICLEGFTSPVRLPCGHVFCEDCIRLHLERDPTCPLDRRKVDEQSQVHEEIRPEHDGMGRTFLRDWKIAVNRIRISLVELLVVLLSLWVLALNFVPGVNLLPLLDIVPSCVLLAYLPRLLVYELLQVPILYVQHRVDSRIVSVATPTWKRRCLSLVERLAYGTTLLLAALVVKEEIDILRTYQLPMEAESQWWYVGRFGGLLAVRLSWESVSLRLSSWICGIPVQQLRLDA
jgi:hypothetical protein